LFITRVLIAEQNPEEALRGWWLTIMGSSIYIGWVWYLLQAGNYTDALGILLVGILIITPIEAILKPHLIGKKSSLHPLAILIGVIGGVGLMGFVGMVYGPLILLIAINLIKFIEETKNIKLTV